MREYNFFDSKKKNPPSTPFQEYAINECGYKTPPASIIFSVIKSMTREDFYQLGVRSITVNHKPILSASYNLFNGERELSQRLYIVNFFVSAQTFFGPNPQPGEVLCLGAIPYDNFSSVSGGLFLAS